MLNVKVTDSVGTIILDRPDKCNALNRALVAELKQAFDDLHQERKVRGIILSGAGNHFCAGLDAVELHETKASEEAMQQWFADAKSIQDLLEQMINCPKPIIAAVDGHVIGTGFALALASDLVIATNRTQFSVPATKLGIVSGWTVPLLTFRLGASTASRVLIGGDTLRAAEAKDMGLVHHIVDPEQLWVRASGWIEEIAEGAAEAVQLTKKVLNEMVGEQLSTLLSSGAAAAATSMTTDAATEGLEAFTLKRPPQFP